jgi:thioredoxin-related protein
MRNSPLFIIRYFLALFLLAPLCSAAQLKRYHFNQVDSLQKIQKRKLLVFIHTDWCRYCEGLNQTTFKNKEVVNLLNKDYYFVELNAEEKKDILFKGNNFVYKRTGTTTGLHELAQKFATIDNSIYYPTLCFMDDKFDLLLRLANYVTAKDLLDILHQISKK